MSTKGNNGRDVGRIEKDHRRGDKRKFRREEYAWTGPVSLVRYRVGMANEFLHLHWVD